MTITCLNHAAPSRSLRDVPTERACMLCKAVFKSEGFGERICPHCKGPAIWTSSLPGRGDLGRQR